MNAKYSALNYGVEFGLVVQQGYGSQAPHITSSASRDVFSRLSRTEAIGNNSYLEAKELLTVVDLELSLMV